MAVDFSQVSIDTRRYWDDSEESQGNKRTSKTFHKLEYVHLESFAYNYIHKNHLHTLIYIIKAEDANIGRRHPLSLTSHFHAKEHSENFCPLIL